MKESIFVTFKITRQEKNTHNIIHILNNCAWQTQACVTLKLVNIQRIKYEHVKIKSIHRFSAPEGLRNMRTNHNKAFPTEFQSPLATAGVVGNQAAGSYGGGQNGHISNGHNTTTAPQYNNNSSNNNNTFQNEATLTYNSKQEQNQQSNSNNRDRKPSRYERRSRSKCKYKFHILKHFNFLRILEPIIHLRCCL